MKLNKTLINSYKPRSNLYRKLDGHGLYIEIAKSGTKTSTKFLYDESLHGDVQY